MLVALALAAVLAATRARRLAARVDALAVDVGGSPETAPTAGDDLPSAPFRYGVIEGARGDHAVVGAALDAMRARGVDFVVLAGDVLDAGDESECRKLAAAIRDRGMPVFAVPGPRDAARADAFERWISPSRWWFVHRRALIVGVPDDSAESRELVRAAEEDARPAAVVRFVGGESRAFGAAVRSCPAVGADERVATKLVALGGAWRWFALDVVAPAVGTTTGYVAWLVACAAVVAAGLAMRRATSRPVATPRRATPLVGSSS
jgi:hypothetical protein